MATFRSWWIFNIFPSVTKNESLDCLRSIPIASMCSIYINILPTFYHICTIKNNPSHVGKYTSPYMDGMGKDDPSTFLALTWPRNLQLSSQLAQNTWGFFTAQVEHKLPQAVVRKVWFFLRPVSFKKPNGPVEVWGIKTVNLIQNPRIPIYTLRNGTAFRLSIIKFVVDEYFGIYFIIFEKVRNWLLLVEKSVSLCISVFLVLRQYCRSKIVNGLPPNHRGKHQWRRTL